MVNPITKVLHKNGWVLSVRATPEQLRSTLKQSATIRLGGVCYFSRDIKVHEPLKRKGIPSEPVDWEKWAREDEEKFEAKRRIWRSESKAIKTNKAREPQRARFNRAAHGRRNELMSGLRDSGLSFRRIGVLAGVSAGRVSQCIAKYKRRIKSQRSRDEQSEQAWWYDFQYRTKGRVDCSVPNERDKWHVWTPETHYAEMN